MAEDTYETHKQRKDEEARKLAEDIGRFVNTYGYEQSIPAFVEALSHEHRTLQQQATRLMLCWFKHLSELPEYHYDLRNEHAVKVAKLVRERLEQEWGSAWSHMPLI